MSRESYAFRADQIRFLEDDFDKVRNELRLMAIGMQEALWCINSGDSGDACKACSEIWALAVLRAYADDDATIESVLKARSEAEDCSPCIARREERTRRGLDSNRPA